MMPNNKIQRALKPDAQAFDEIRIRIVPRYKTSGLSGDQWRISTTTEFWRKGKLVHEVHHGDMRSAAACLGYDYLNAEDNGLGFFAGEGDVCDQEGCQEPATVTYRILKEFCRDHPFYHQKELTGEVRVRKFCARHSRRGDQSFDDSDTNYEPLNGKPSDPQKQDVSPSVFGGIISADKLGL
jgi:hypothetical protein